MLKDENIANIRAKSSDNPPYIACPKVYQIIINCSLMIQNLRLLSYNLVYIMSMLL